MKLLWSTPTMPKQPIPQSQLHTNTPASGASIRRQPGGPAPAADPDDLEQALLDGASGFDTVLELPGAAAMSSRGLWARDHGIIYAVGQGGTVGYQFQVTNGLIYRLEIRGASHSPLDPDSVFHLVVSLDGQALGRTALAVPRGRPGCAKLLTPWIAPGPHRLDIEWDDIRKDRSLAITAVRLLASRPGSPGTSVPKDWIAALVESRNSIAPPGAALQESDAGSPGPSPLVVYSATSPACVEGCARYQLTLSARAGGQSLAPRHGTQGHWYCEVPLSRQGPTRFEAVFENGALREERWLVWRPINVLEGKQAAVRAGDTLCFVAVPPAGSSSLPDPGALADGVASIDVIGAGHYSTSAGGRVFHRFDKAGTFVVTAEYRRRDGTSETGSMAVRVFELSLGDDLAAWAGKPRAWHCPRLPDGVVLEADPCLGMDGALAARPGGATYDLLVDAAEDRFILARLGEHGPVLASTTVHGLNIAGVRESGACYAGEYPDRSRLVQTAVAPSRILNDVRVEMQIIVGGVMFDDGALVRVLRAGDFDDTRLARVNFIMPPGALTSNCHVMRAYQDQACLGEY
jgi:hypothetical protein